MVIITNVNSISNSLCVIINKDSDNPLCMFLTNIQTNINASCPVGQCVNGVQDNGTLICASCSGAGGEGTNYWQVDGTWMSPNATSGGQQNINITGNMNASNFYGSGAGLTDILAYNETYNTWSYNQTSPAISWVQSQGYLTAFIENDPYYFSNSLGYLNYTYNSTYDTYNYRINDTLIRTYNSTYDVKPSNTYNSTYDIKPSNTYNSTYDAKNAYNSSYEWFNNATIFQTYNSTYDTISGGGNTTNEIFVAVNNGTFQKQIKSINLTGQYNGSFINGSYIGYQAGNQICNITFPNSHLCTCEEIILNIDFAKNVGSIEGWCSSGGGKYVPATTPVDDCYGFRYDLAVSATHLGSRWLYNTTMGGFGGAVNCATLNYMSCCLVSG